MNGGQLEQFAEEVSNVSTQWRAFYSHLYIFYSDIKTEIGKEGIYGSTSLEFRTFLENAWNLFGCNRTNSVLFKQTVYAADDASKDEAVWKIDWLIIFALVRQFPIRKLIFVVSVTISSFYCGFRNELCFRPNRHNFARTYPSIHLITRRCSDNFTRLVVKLPQNTLSSNRPNRRKVSCNFWTKKTSLDVHLFITPVARGILRAWKIWFVLGLALTWKTTTTKALCILLPGKIKGFSGK